MGKYNDIENLLYFEVEKRLKIMSERDYMFPEKIKAIDWCLITISIGLSIILIVLCVMGVID